jgi:CysZ protein
MLHNVLKGTFSYFKAFELIFSTRLKWFLLIPVLLQALAILLGEDLASQFGTEIRTHLGQWISQSSWPIFKTSTAQYFIVKTSATIFKSMIVFLFLTVGGYLILIVLSPILAITSAITEDIVNQKNYIFTKNTIWHDICRSVKLSVRNLLILSGFVLVTIIISIIPYLGWFLALFLSTIVLFLVASYFYGSSFMDYTCKRKNLNARDSRLFIIEHNGFAIANGIVFTLFLALPFLGIFLSGFMAIISTVAATIGIEEIIKKEGINLE